MHAVMFRRFFPFTCASHGDAGGFAVKVLDAVPKGRVLDAITTDGTDIRVLARHAVDQTISEMSEYLSDDDVSEVAAALHGLLNRWQEQRTNK